MGSRPTDGMVMQTTPNDRILRIDATSLATLTTGNGRLSTVDGIVKVRPYERVIIVGASTASGSYTLHMPNAMSCIGEHFLIYGGTFANSKEVTVADEAGNDLVSDNLSAAADFVLLFSYGAGWLVVTETTT